MREGSKFILLFISSCKNVSWTYLSTWRSLAAVTNAVSSSGGNGSQTRAESRVNEKDRKQRQWDINNTYDQFGSEEEGEG